MKIAHTVGLAAEQGQQVDRWWWSQEDHHHNLAAIELDSNNMEQTNPLQEYIEHVDQIAAHDNIAAIQYLLAKLNQD